MLFKKKWVKLCVVMVALAISNTSTAGSTARDWAKITQPTPQREDGGQSIGTYNSGCLDGGVMLPLEGTGYQVMRLSRKRYYGHQTLIDFIQNVGKAVASEKIGTVLVGDLGQPRGGPTLSGHRSHQTGLDVDMWFLLSDIANNRKLTANERETWSASTVVHPKTDAIIENQWSIANERVLELVAQQPDVDRVFVNASVKRALCANKKEGSTEWLRKIRPWFKHDDHFHVRLKCPDNNTQCDGQGALPVGDGCDSSLDWWFTAEAKTPSKNKPTPPPPLPASCERLLKQ
jgi:penicillin-insensitive murein DD-endopeptidase